MSELATEFPAFHTPDSNELRLNHFAVIGSGAKDDQKIVAFSYKESLNRQKSRDQGVPIYDRETWVRIQNPGEVDYIHRKARQEDVDRWPRAFAQFQQGKKQVSEGTPLDILFPDRPEIVARLTSLNIQTVQQLANLSAEGISKVGMGAQQWVNSAQSFIKTSEKGVDHHKFNAALEQKDRQIETLQGQVNQLSEQINNLMQKINTQAEAGANLVAFRPGRFGGLPSPDENFDYQQSALENREQPQPGPIQPVNFSNSFDAPDLSTLVNQQPKKGGRPKGSKNKPKET